MKKYLGALDQGTTSTRFSGIRPRRKHRGLQPRKSTNKFIRSPGWVEHRPLEIWARTQEMIDAACASKGITAADIACIGITNQRETTVVWNKRTGEPVYNALVWQDTRVGETVAQFAAEGGQDRFRAKTGRTSSAGDVLGLQSV